MRYVAAYLLAVLGGNKSPSATDIEKILGSVGIEVEADRLKKVISELNGKDVNDIMSQGKEKLASMPAGGGVSSAAAPAAGSDAKGGSPAKESKKEEKKDSDEGGSDEDMGFGLFD